MSIIFVTGSSRSGTTMMSRVLNNNPVVFSFNELHFFEQLCEPAKLNVAISYDEALNLCDRLVGIQNDGFLVYKKRGKYNDNAKAILKSITDANYTPVKVYIAFIAAMAQSHGKQIGCDQTPRNVLYIEDILNNVPEAKIICMVRDPRSVLLSQKNKWKRRFLGARAIPLKESIRSYFNYHPYTITKLWLAATRQSVKWEDDKRVFTLKFEDIVDDPEKMISRVCAFLDIEFKPAMLQIPHFGSSHKTDAGSKLEISSSAKAVWKEGGLTRAELYISQNIAQKIHG